MSSLHGKFVWVELMTTDPDAATAFYQAAIGWTAKDAGMPGWRYTILSAGGTGVGGLMELPQEVREAGGRPSWMGYIAVDDVDAYAERVVAAGGKIHRAADDIPGVGRFAVVAEPQGPVFTLFKPLPMQNEPAPPAPGAPGHLGWRELHTQDWQAAFAFYSGLFGWTKTEAIDMGPMGTYQTFAAGGPMIGGMMNRGDADPARGWLYYFNVDGIDAAIGRVKDAGGQTVHGPQQVPGGSWIAQCVDPQGAMFAMVAPPPG